ncbi:hypothetical protein E1262_16410 [Jiangella aurantiaca]|uniref:Uncharacterized protein n=1 Tax=Jiangella aurantiaca TaxID=2530373 RepID=A0A4R5A976_9ACTN|nr:hypothetical protein [Jiangella aurantiaca]TDD68175.1 hypothetical protein E1262_16410 [Jiangella aurantiaca]
MNVKYLAKFGGSALSAGTAVRSLSKARRDKDGLRMIDAVLSILSVAITIAIIVREIRESRDENKPLVELKDGE